MEWSFCVTKLSKSASSREVCLRGFKTRDVDAHNTITTTTHQRVVRNATSRWKLLRVAVVAEESQSNLKLIKIFTTQPHVPELWIQQNIVLIHLTKHLNGHQENGKLWKIFYLCKINSTHLMWECTVISVPRKYTTFTFLRHSIPNITVYCTSKCK